MSEPDPAEARVDRWLAERAQLTSQLRPSAAFEHELLVAAQAELALLDAERGEVGEWQQWHLARASLGVAAVLVVVSLLAAGLSGGGSAQTTAASDGDEWSSEVDW